jgi:gluconolactonase
MTLGIGTIRSPEEDRFGEDEMYVRTLALVGALWLGAAGEVLALDPVPLYPDNYKVLFENDRVRVLDFRLAKGATEVMHDHPANVAIFLADFTIRFTLPDGSTKLRVGHPGEVSYSGPARHSPVNVGDTDAHGVIVELKGEGEAPSEALTAFTRIHGLPGHEEDLKAHLLSLAAPTHAEPGAIRYDLYQSPSQPAEFLRHEVWASEAALEAHKKSPPLMASWEKRQREGWSTDIQVWKRVPEPALVGSIERFDPRFDALVPRDAVLERVAEDLVWAEGPLWDRSDGSLLFSDVPRNTIFRWKDGAGVVKVLERSGYTGDRPFTGPEPGSNGLTWDREGRLVFCQHGDRRIVRREKDGSLTVIADRFEGKRFNSPNDLVYRSNGDLYFTDPPFGLPGTFTDAAKEIPFQGVYRVTPKGDVSAVVRDLEAPNGIAFSPDEKTLYVSNSTGAWMAYDVRPDGRVGRGRVFADPRGWRREGEGGPDGLKVDREGNVWATGPAGVTVFAPDGARLGRLVTGVKTGNVAWGENGDVLFIAANHWILRVRTRTRGF